MGGVSGVGLSGTGDADAVLGDLPVTQHQHAADLPIKPSVKLW